MTYHFAAALITLVSGARLSEVVVQKQNLEKLHEDDDDDGMREEVPGESFVETAMKGVPINFHVLYRDGRNGLPGTHDLMLLFEQQIMDPQIDAKISALGGDPERLKNFKGLFDMSASRGKPGDSKKGQAYFKESLKQMQTFPRVPITMTEHQSMNVYIRELEKQISPPPQAPYMIIGLEDDGGILSFAELGDKLQGLIERGLYGKSRNVCVIELYDEGKLWSATPRRGIYMHEIYNDGYVGGEMSKLEAIVKDRP